MRKLKTVKERVHQIKSDNDQLTTNYEESAQALGKFFSGVFLNERDGHDTESEEVVAYRKKKVGTSSLIRTQ